MTRLRTHPGEVLKEEYLVPLEMSARALAKELGVPANRLTEIIRGTRDVTADTAIRLGRYFRTDPRFWLTHPRPYPELARYGFRWIKLHRYWFAWHPGPPPR